MNLNRFLMEVEDILRITHPLISFDHALYSISHRKVDLLKSQFIMGVPFPYLLKESEFYYSRFYLNENVLIPRPETEILVDLIVREQKGKVSQVLDVGTGSGVILLSLLKNGVGRKGTGADISEDALDVMKVNVRRLGLEDKATSLLSDRLQKVEGTFDLIVSNPPYIKATAHRPLVHSSVNSFEPHRALYLPDDEYDQWFEDFFQQVKRHLKGVFYMEGHEFELENQAKKLRVLGFRDVVVLNDLAGQKRFLRCSFGT